MPRKDGEKTNRQNKRDSKKKGGSGPYSSKHIRIQESLQQNKGSFKDESNVLKRSTHKKN